MSAISITISSDTPASVMATSLIRTDTGGSVTLDPPLPQAFTAAGGGVYTFSFLDPAPGLVYQLQYVITWPDGSTDSFPASLDGPGAALAIADGLSSFERAMTATLGPGLFAAFGAPGIYSPPNSTAIVQNLSLRVHRDDPTEFQRPNGSKGVQQTGEILVQQCALPRPLKHGRFTVRGVEVWTLTEDATLENGEWVCIVKRIGLERMLEKRANQ